jgi:spore germination protein GerM
MAKTAKTEGAESVKPKPKPRKAAGGVKKKKAAKATKPRAAKKTAGTAVPTKPGTAVYVLTIMGLLTALALLVAKNYTGVSETSKRTAPNTEHKTVKDDDSSKSAPHGEEPKKADAESRVRIYFVRFDERTERTSLEPVMRSVRKEFAVKDSLNELIKGPSETEKRRGLLSAVPQHLRVRAVAVENGVAVIDFNDAIEENANGGILLSRVDQIVYTATQFDGVGGVVFKINGKTRKFLGSDGLAIGGPIQRKAR